MATNNFKPFAAAAGANVMTQADYEALAALLTGFVSGTAQSQQLNKVWRQSSIMAAVLAQFIVDRTGQNAIDDGTTATLLANLKLSAPAFTDVAARSMVMFTSSGTFTVPVNITRLKVTLVGGGASGGGCFSASTYTNAAGGGGGAGGIAIGWFAVTPGQNIPYTIGAGGPAVSNGSSFGGTSSIPLLGLTANGGNPSTLANSSSPGGSGGTATGGQINIQGSSGTDGQNVSAFVFGGKGGDGIFGGGGRAGSGAGSGGSAPGAGGGGAYDLSASNTAKSGGAGYSGAVIFEW
ncbi:MULTISPECIES: glycine-rich domain-containing protein [unclassified Burkholderia]|uniref:glycine-rich domain-containing protein n=1 Tax=unclassified Burkholderia TaxID=2613784 RepID=UPI001D12C904|nr:MULTISPECIES: hypothetical protein [unclassified Burkholderia]